ncbi:hypothetical protein LIS77_02895 [Cytobacillus firmus]|uniref:hypothetical protein n=1 Tax=Cytobacillus firmus TaxID=1399 RepID=UPI00207AA928|nr:hypothetical protein [Cytobacillus firmus]USK39497.1 hypothetical protein LIS77_02895 [Cytobacillus firmus]
MVRRVTNWHHTQMKWGNEVYWIAIFIYFLLIGSAFWLERLLKWKFNIPKKREYTKRFNKQQTVIESLIFVVFLFNEHIMEFAFAVWSPILIVIAYHATVAFF